MRDMGTVWKNREAGIRYGLPQLLNLRPGIGAIAVAPDDQSLGNNVIEPGLTIPAIHCVQPCKQGLFSRHLRNGCTGLKARRLLAV